MLHARSVVVLLSILPSSSLLSGTAAHAAYLGVTWENDTFGLDGVTPLVDIAGYGGERVINVYALFDNAANQAIGVVGSPQNRFTVQTSNGSSFINDTTFGEDEPVSAALVNAFGFLNWDSFYTVGTKFSDDQSTEIVVAPGTPSPDGSPWGGGNTSVAWLVPPTIDGVPTPETVAGPDMRVLLMRLVVQPNTTVSGEFGVLIFTEKGSDEVNSSFVAAPAPGALSLLCMACLVGTTRRRA